MLTFMNELERTLPFKPHQIQTPDQQDAQNTTALVWFFQRGVRPSLANQVREHIELAHTDPDYLMSSTGAY